ncbi:mediator of RNA polymerase II transcription subunit 15 isoform X5 [Drosophila serrata]|uniref:mediator of RNA polymerase II transcription subunit 15 isoform X5 n=1 Tax=Drosophila serrata TaxID=7274 RepID=UPI000A1D3124|nr:mediator of RNA polymerase II transcription subunit 15 isoform X5 [Drosophila serrata]
MAQRKLVHKQFNSPMGLYSQENVKATLNRELKAFGAEGIEVDEQITKPLNLANSAVLRAVEEEEQQAKCGYKRVAWPPASEERIIREFTPQPQTQSPAPGSGGYYPQAGATVAPQPAAAPAQQQQQYGAPSYDGYQQQPPQQQQQHPAPQWQQQQQQPAPQWQQQQQQQPAPQWQQPQSQAQPQTQAPYHQQQQQPQWNQQQQPSYQTSPYQQQQQQQQPSFYPQQNGGSTYAQPQYNSYSQPQQQLGQLPYSQDQTDQQQQQQPGAYRGASPGIITLRKEAPVSQQPAPVYTSQPAAVSYQGGSKLRGDLKWPPPEYKEAAARENEERRQLALGPVCRPRRVNRDYTTFFAKHQLNNGYPSYKVPPGTQHMWA